MKKITKAAALLTLIFFLIHDIGRAAVPAVSLPQNEVKIFSPLQLDIPPDLGTVESSKAGSGPLLIHIQTAHGNYEAQKKIQAILHHLRKKYGVRTMFLEGTAFKLRPEILRFFPHHMDLTMKVADQLAKKALVRGSELFLLEDSSAQAYGIEDLKLYRKNRAAFQAVLGSDDKISSFFKKVDTSAENFLARHVNLDLRSFIKRLDAFDSKHISLTEFLPYLKEQSFNHLHIDISDPAYQIDWPILVRLFKLQEFEQKLNRPTFEKERAEFLRAIKPVIPHPLYQPIKTLLSSNVGAIHELPLQDPGTNLLFEQMAAALPRNFDYSAFPNVNLFIGHLILQSELKTPLLMKEIDHLSVEIKTALAKTPEEKRFVKFLEAYRMLQRLLKLELTAEDWQTIEQNAGAIHELPLRPSDLVLEISDKKSRDPEIDSLFEQALEFYRLASARDQKMIENVLKRFKETGENKAIIVTGGFHAPSFRNFFEANGYSYALVSPKISGSEADPNFEKNLKAGHRAYVEAMLQRKIKTPAVSTLEDTSLMLTRSEIRAHGADPDWIDREVLKTLRQTLRETNNRSFFPHYRNYFFRNQTLRSETGDTSKENNAAVGEMGTRYQKLLSEVRMDSTYRIPMPEAKVFGEIISRFLKRMLVRSLSPVTIAAALAAMAHSKTASSSGSRQAFILMLGSTIIAFSWMSVMISSRIVGEINFFSFGFSSVLKKSSNKAGERTIVNLSSSRDSTMERQTPGNTTALTRTLMSRTTRRIPLLPGFFDEIQNLFAGYGHFFAAFVQPLYQGTESFSPRLLFESLNQGDPIAGSQLRNNFFDLFQIHLNSNFGHLLPLLFFQYTLSALPNQIQSRYNGYQPWIPRISFPRSEVRVGINLSLVLAGIAALGEGVGQWILKSRRIFSRPFRYFREKRILREKLVKAGANLHKVVWSEVPDSIYEQIRELHRQGVPFTVDFAPRIVEEALLDTRVNGTKANGRRWKILKSWTSAEQQIWIRTAPEISRSENRVSLAAGSRDLIGDIDTQIAWSDLPRRFPETLTAEDLDRIDRDYLIRQLEWILKRLKENTPSFWEKISQEKTWLGLTVELFFSPAFGLPSLLFLVHDLLDFFAPTEVLQTKSLIREIQKYQPGSSTEFFRNSLERKIRSLKRKAIFKIWEFLRHRQPRVRYAALRALEDLARASEPPVAALQKALGDYDYLLTRLFDASQIVALKNEFEYPDFLPPRDDIKNLYYPAADTDVRRVFEFLRYFPSIQKIFLVDPNLEKARMEEVIKTAVLEEDPEAGIEVIRADDRGAIVRAWLSGGRFVEFYYFYQGYEDFSPPQNLRPDLILVNYPGNSAALNKGKEGKKFYQKLFKDANDHSLLAIHDNALHGIPRLLKFKWLREGKIKYVGRGRLLSNGTPGLPWRVYEFRSSRSEVRNKPENWSAGIPAWAFEALNVLPQEFRNLITVQSPEVLAHRMTRYFSTRLDSALNAKHWLDQYLMIEKGKIIPASPLAQVPHLAAINPILAFRRLILEALLDPTLAGWLARFDERRQFLKTTLFFAARNALGPLTGSAAEGAVKLVQSGYHPWLRLLDHFQSEPYLLSDLKSAIDDLGRLVENPSSANHVLMTHVLDDIKLATMDPLLSLCEYWEEKKVRPILDRAVTSLQWIHRKGGLGPNSARLQKLIADPVGFILSPEGRAQEIYDDIMDHLNFSNLQGFPRTPEAMNDLFSKTSERIVEALRKDPSAAKIMIRKLAEIGNEYKPTVRMRMAQLLDKLHAGSKLAGKVRETLERDVRKQIESLELGLRNLVNSRHFDGWSGDPFQFWSQADRFQKEISLLREDYEQIEFDIANLKPNTKLQESPRSEVRTAKTVPEKSISAQAVPDIDRWQQQFPAENDRFFHLKEQGALPHTQLSLNFFKKRPDRIKQLLSFLASDTPVNLNRFRSDDKISYEFGGEEFSLTVDDFILKNLLPILLAVAQDKIDLNIVTAELLKRVTLPDRVSEIDALNGWEIWDKSKAIDAIVQILGSSHRRRRFQNVPVEAKKIAWGETLFGRRILLTVAAGVSVLSVILFVKMAFQGSQEPPTIEDLKQQWMSRGIQWKDTTQEKFLDDPEVFLAIHQVLSSFEGSLVTSEKGQIPQIEEVKLRDPDKTKGRAKQPVAFIISIKRRNEEKSFLERTIRLDSKAGDLRQFQNEFFGAPHQEHFALRQVFRISLKALPFLLGSVAGLVALILILMRRGPFKERNKREIPKEIVEKLRRQSLGKYYRGPGAGETSSRSEARQVPRKNAVRSPRLAALEVAIAKKAGIKPSAIRQIDLSRDFEWLRKLRKPRQVFRIEGLQAFLNQKGLPTSGLAPTLTKLSDTLEDLIFQTLRPENALDLKMDNLSDDPDKYIYMDKPLAFIFRETLKNAVLHGNRLDLTLPVYLSWDIDQKAGRLVIEVFDTANQGHSISKKLNRQDIRKIKMGGSHLGRKYIRKIVGKGYSYSNSKRRNGLPYVFNDQGEILGHVERIRIRILKDASRSEVRNILDPEPAEKILKFLFDEIKSSSIEEHGISFTRFTPEQGRRLSIDFNPEKNNEKKGRIQFFYQPAISGIPRSWRVHFFPLHWKELKAAKKNYLWVFEWNVQGLKIFSTKNNLGRSPRKSVIFIPASPGKKFLDIVLESSPNGAEQPRLLVTDQLRQAVQAKGILEEIGSPGLFISKRQIKFKFKTAAKAGQKKGGQESKEYFLRLLEKAAEKAGKQAERYSSPGPLSLKAELKDEEEEREANREKWQVLEMNFRQMIKEVEQDQSFHLSSEMWAARVSHRTHHNPNAAKIFAEVLSEDETESTGGFKNPAASLTEVSRKRGPKPKPSRVRSEVRKAVEIKTAQPKIFDRAVTSPIAQVPLAKTLKIYHGSYQESMKTIVLPSAEGRRWTRPYRDSNPDLPLRERVALSNLSYRAARGKNKGNKNEIQDFSKKMPKSVQIPHSPSIRSEMRTEEFSDSLNKQSMTVDVVAQKLEREFGVETIKREIGYVVKQDHLKETSWTMNQVRPVERRPIATALGGFEIKKLVFPLEILPKFSEKGTSSAGTYLGFVEGVDFPVVIKMLHSNPNPFHADSIRELVTAQILDQLGVGPRFLGLIRFSDEKIGYVMQTVPGRNINTVEDPEELEKVDQTWRAGLSLASLIKTPSGHVVQIDVGNSILFDKKRYDEFIQESNSVKDPRSEVRLAPKTKTARPENFRLQPSGLLSINQRTLDSRSETRLVRSGMAMRTASSTLVSRRSTEDSRSSTRSIRSDNPSTFSAIMPTSDRKPSIRTPTSVAVNDLSSGDFLDIFNTPQGNQSGKTVAQKPALVNIKNNDIKNLEISYPMLRFFRGWILPLARVKQLLIWGVAFAVATISRILGRQAYAEAVETIPFEGYLRKKFPGADWFRILPVILSPNRKTVGAIHELPLPRTHKDGSGILDLDQETFLETSKDPRAAFSLLQLADQKRTNGQPFIHVRLPKEQIAKTKQMLVHAVRNRSAAFGKEVVERERLIAELRSGDLIRFIEANEPEPGPKAAVYWRSAGSKISDPSSVVFTFSERLRVQDRIIAVAAMALTKELADILPGLKPDQIKQLVDSFLNQRMPGFRPNRQGIVELFDPEQFLNAKYIETQA